MTHQWEDDGGTPDVGSRVCITHGRHVPCRDSNGIHLETDSEFWISHVRTFQRSDQGVYSDWGSYLDMLTEQQLG